MLWFRKPTTPRPLSRTFQTKFFARQARKARIGVEELRRIVREVAEGKAIDLGGGVFKKRLQQNAYRSILLAKSADYWVLEFLFAKKDADTITPAALDGFRTLATAYTNLKPAQLAQLLRTGEWEEMFHDDHP